MSRERDMVLRLQGLTMAASMLDEWSKMKVDHVTEARARAWREAAGSLRAIPVQKMHWNEISDEPSASAPSDLSALVEGIFEQQTSVGYWGMDADHMDYSGFFSEIHAKVSKAFESYSDDSEPKTVIWLDLRTGRPGSVGSGIPHGLPVSLAEIVFEVLGFMRQLQIDVPVLLTQMLMVEKAINTQILSGDEDEPEVEESEGDEAAEGHDEAVEENR